MSDKRKQPSPLWPVGFCWILCSSIIVAIIRIFTTPLDTSANDLGVAGIGSLVAHPIIYGLKGAAEGAFLGFIFFILERAIQDKHD